jgi:hypothetical protein
MSPTLSTGTAPVEQGNFEVEIVFPRGRPLLEMMENSSCLLKVL